MLADSFIVEITFNTESFHRDEKRVLTRIVARIRRDLETGAWTPCISADLRKHAPDFISNNVFLQVEYFGTCMHKTVVGEMKEIKNGEFTGKTRDMFLQNVDAGIIGVKMFAIYTWQDAAVAWLRDEVAKYGGKRVKKVRIFMTEETTY